MDTWDNWNNSNTLLHKKRDLWQLIKIIQYYHLMKGHPEGKPGISTNWIIEILTTKKDK
jgi:hypothetical protein